MLELANYNETNALSPSSRKRETNTFSLLPFSIARAMRLLDPDPMTKSNNCPTGM
jgi:hypothetical protein